MKTLEKLAFTNVTPPAAIVDNAAFATASVDCKECSEVMFLVQLGALDIAVAALKLRESDDDSTYTDVSGADYSVDSVLPSATSDNGLYAVRVKNMSARKRYLDLSLTGGDGTSGSYASVLCIRVPKTLLTSATNRGLTAELAV